MLNNMKLCECGKPTRPRGLKCEKCYESQPHVVVTRKAWRAKNAKHLLNAALKWQDNNAEHYKQYQREYQKKLYYQRKHKND